MARLPTIGGDKNNWGNVLNEYLSVSHNNDGTIRSDLLPSGFTRSVRIVAESVKAESSGRTDYVYIASGSIIIALPTAVGNNCRYSVVNNGTNTVSIEASNPQTINGSQTATIPIQNMCLSLVSDGSNWIIT